jgi:hypothetical protein
VQQVTQWGGGCIIACYDDLMFFSVRQVEQVAR